MKRRPTKAQVEAAIMAQSPPRTTWVRCPRTRRAIALALRLVTEGRAADEAAKHAAEVCGVDGPTVFNYVLERIEAGETSLESNNRGGEDR